MYIPNPMTRLKLNYFLYSTKVIGQKNSLDLDLPGRVGDSSPSTLYKCTVWSNLTNGVNHECLVYWQQSLTQATTQHD